MRSEKGLHLFTPWIVAYSLEESNRRLRHINCCIVIDHHCWTFCDWFRKGGSNTNLLRCRGHSSLFSFLNSEFEKRFFHKVGQTQYNEDRWMPMIRRDTQKRIDWLHRWLHENTLNKELQPNVQSPLPKRWEPIQPNKQATYTTQLSQSRKQKYNWIWIVIAWSPFGMNHLYLLSIYMPN